MNEREPIVYPKYESEEAMRLAIAQPLEIPGLTEGRMVHWVNERGVHRPAIIVQVWNKITGCSNLQAFIDGTNDGFDKDQGTYWVCSADYSAEPVPFTWHFIEKA